jgi:hypothetical protein
MLSTPKKPVKKQYICANTRYGAGETSTPENTLKEAYELFRDNFGHDTEFEDLSFFEVIPLTVKLEEHIIQVPTEV